MEQLQSEQTHSTGAASASRAPSHAAPSSFGRGWIPASRDIGLPGDDALAFSPVAPAEAGVYIGSQQGGWLGVDGDGLSGPLPAQGRREGEGPFASSPATRHDGWTPERKVRFLDHLSHSGNVRAACAAVALSPEAAYRLRRRDGLFAQAWAAALVVAREAAEQVLADRALNGVAEPIFYRGEQVGARVRFDGRLLLAHLARLDRAAAACPPGRAERFDELVALVAGEEPDDRLFGWAGMAAEGAATPGSDPRLPLTRAAIAGDAARRAGQAARHAEEGDDPWIDEEDFDPVIEAEECRVAEAEDAAYDAAAARWDAWFARACAVVDAAAGGGAEPSPANDPIPPVRAADGEVAGPQGLTEGHGGDRPSRVSPSTTRCAGGPLPHPPRGRGGSEAGPQFKSLDPVMSVNFAAPDAFAAPADAAGDNRARGLGPRLTLC